MRRAKTHRKGVKIQNWTNKFSLDLQACPKSSFGQEVKRVRESRKEEEGEEVGNHGKMEEKGKSKTDLGRKTEKTVNASAK